VKVLCGGIINIDDPITRPERNGAHEG
jgi:hypothetical protein